MFQLCFTFPWDSGSYKKSAICLGFFLFKLDYEATLYFLCCKGYQTL